MNCVAGANPTTTQARGQEGDTTLLRHCSHLPGPLASVARLVTLGTSTRSRVPTQLGTQTLQFPCPQQSESHTPERAGRKISPAPFQRSQSWEVCCVSATVTGTLGWLSGAPLLSQHTLFLAAWVDPASWPKGSGVPRGQE